MRYLASVGLDSLDHSLEKLPHTEKEDKPEVYFMLLSWITILPYLLSIF